jgi:hypothetical protein
MLLASWGGARAAHAEPSMPRKIRDLALAALGAALLLGALALVDGRVPGRLAGMVRDVAAGRWAEPGSVAGELLIAYAASPLGDNTIVVAFIVAALVLVFLMVRT